VILVTLALAAASAGVQTVIRGSSRPNPPGKTHGLTRDDALFWSEWVVSATVTLVGTTFVAIAKSSEISLPLWGGAVGTLVVSCVAVPFLLRVLAHDPTTGNMKNGLGWLICVNSVGLVTLLAAVAAGANVYDFS
jgi:hypothetical protein